MKIIKKYIFSHELDYHFWFEIKKEWLYDFFVFNCYERKHDLNLDTYMINRFLGKMKMLHIPLSFEMGHL